MEECVVLGDGMMSQHSMKMLIDIRVITTVTLSTLLFTTGD